MPIQWLTCFLCLLVQAGSVSCLVAAPFRYPEAKHGQGELCYVNGVPVLQVAGSPEEIGEQMGVLALRPAVGGLGLMDEFLTQQGLAPFKGVLGRVGNALLAKCPEAYRREIDAAARAGGVDRDLLVIGNTFHDVRRAFGCAGLMVAPARSMTGAALMGRNLDYHLVPGMQAYSLVIVYRPVGKRPFAVVSFPGALLVGCAMSAMNGAGLALGQNDVVGSADGSSALDLQNTPTAVLARRILEECATVPEAARLVEARKPASRALFVLCDRDGGGVVEATPKTSALRRGAAGLCMATNCFQCAGLSVSEKCLRGEALAHAARIEKLSVADVAKKLGEAHQELDDPRPGV